MKTSNFKNIPLFSDVDDNIFEKLVKSGDIHESRYNKNATVHSQGEECNVLDVVLSGSLVAYSLSQNGSENVMFKFRSKSVIGANLLFGDNNRYPLNIYCMTDCRLLHINKSGVSELLKDYNFVIQYIKSISQNSQGMNRKIVMFSQKSLRTNLLDYLDALSLEQNSKTVTLPLTKKQLADYFGVQRPSLFRVFKELKDEGIIDIDNRKITIRKE